MVLHLKLIIQDNIFHFIPKIHLHIAKDDDDFSVFSISWLCFNFVSSTQELISAATYWRQIVEEMVDNDKEKMKKFDGLVNKYMEYTDEQFSHKAKYIANGCI